MDVLFPLRVCSPGVFCWYCGGTIRTTGPRYAEPAVVKEICIRYGFHPSTGFLYVQGDLILDWVNESSPEGFFVELNRLLVRDTIEECPSDLVPERSRVCSGYVVRLPLLRWTGLSRSERTFEYNYLHTTQNFMGGFSISPDGNAGMTSEARRYNASCVLRWVNEQSRRTHELWPLILWCIKHGDLEEVSHVLLSWTGKKKFHQRVLCRENWEILFEWMSITENCHRSPVNGWAKEAHEKNWLLLCKFLTPASEKAFYEGPAGWTQKIGGVPATFEHFFYQPRHIVPDLNLHAMLTFGSRRAKLKHLSKRCPHRIDYVRANNAPPHALLPVAKALCFAEQYVSGDTTSPDVSVPLEVDDPKIPDFEVYRDFVSDFEVYRGVSFEKMLAITDDDQVNEEYSSPVSLLAGSDQRCTDDNGCRWPELVDPRLEAPRVCCTVPKGATDWDESIINRFRYTAINNLHGVDA